MARKKETLGIADNPEAAATEAAETKTSETAAPNAAENQTETGNLIYVGASLPGIKTNTTISGDIPAILDVPFVRELVIPTDKFTEFLKNKAVTESRAAFCYRKSAEYAETLKEGKK